MAIPELSVVALTRDLHVGRIRIKEGTTGTVVHVWNDGVAYEIEFDRTVGAQGREAERSDGQVREDREHCVITARPEDIRVVWTPK